MNEDYGQPCVIRAGESVTILSEGYRLPDGTTTTTIEGCEFESDSSVVLEQPTDPTPVVLPEATTPTKQVSVPADPTPAAIAVKHEPDVPTHLPKSYSPAADELPNDPANTQVLAVVVEQALPKPPSLNHPGPSISMPIIVAAVAVTAAVAGVMSAGSSAKGKRGKGKRKPETKQSNQEQRRKEREEQQEKCATQSDRVDQHIQQVVQLATGSKTASLNIQDPVELYGEIASISGEVEVLSKIVKKKTRRS